MRQDANANHSHLRLHLVLDGITVGFTLIGFLPRGLPCQGFYVRVGFTSKGLPPLELNGGGAVAGDINTHQSHNQSTDPHPPPIRMKRTLQKNFL